MLNRTAAAIFLFLTSWVPCSTAFAGNEIAMKVGTAPTMPAAPDPATSAADAKLAISQLSVKDWSIADGDDLLLRVVSQSSREGLQALAASGDFRAETLVGVGLLEGTSGFPRDEVAAAHEFDLASKSGFAAALVMLGFMHEYGLGGLPQDDKTAVELFQRAADLGDAGGEMCLGDMFLKGRGGLPNDRIKAVQLYRKSSQQGDKRAADMLAALGEQP